MNLTQQAPRKAIPLRDFRHFSQAYSSSLDFKNFKNVLDIGCGPGNLTIDEILPLLSKNFKKLVGIDVSKVMIEYANANCKKDERVHFYEMDVATKEIPLKFKNEFDLITSVYCLQWVPDFKRAFDNMFEMLNPGGEIFVIILCQEIFFDVCKLLRNSEKFGRYLTTFESTFAPVVFSDHPDELLRKTMASSGFEVKDCGLHKNTMELTEKMLRELTTTLDIFGMPEDVRDDFASYHVDHAKKFYSVSESPCGEEVLHCPYNILVAHATK